MNIAEYAIQKRTITLVMMALMLFGGISSYQGLSRLEDPEFTIKEALIITGYPGASPSEVEQEVTDVIETEIQKMSQIDYLESISKAGVSTITVAIKKSNPKESLPAIWEELRRKINDVRPKLPPGVNQPTVLDDFGDVYGVLFAITGDGYTYNELEDYVDFLQRELLLVQDVAKIDINGIQPEAIYVEISRSKLSQLGISLDQIYNTLAKQNMVVPAGSIQVGPDYVRISPTGEIHAVTDIENLLIPSTSFLNFSDDQSQRLIYLKDIATVTRGYQEPPTKMVRFNNMPAVLMGISTIAGGNVVTMGEALYKRLGELEEQTPVGLEINVVSMQSDAVTESINNFVVSLAQAIFIVIAVLLFFMGVRSGLLIGGILLITVVATFILMDINNVALERISLGALVIALGMLVDNAIVVCDGMMVRIESGMDRLKAANEVVAQTIWPLFGATVIAILAFAAIGMSEDSTGEFCRSLYQVVLYSLSLSWVIAITVTPLLCYMFLAGPKEGTVSSSAGSNESNDPYAHPLYQSYKAFLIKCIKHRAVTLGVVVGLFFMSVYAFGFLDKNFFPSSSRPQMMIHYWAPEGTDIRQTSADMSVIEDKLLNDERVQDVSAVVGGGAPRFLLTYSPEKDNFGYGYLLVTVHDFDNIDGMLLEYREYIASNFLNAESKFEKFRLGPGGGSTIEVRVSGPDPHVLRELSEQVQVILREDGKSIDIRDDWRQRVKVIRPNFNEMAARYSGVTREELNRALEANFTGTSVGLYREDDKLIPIVHRAPIYERLDVSEINNLQVWSRSRQTTIPIQQVTESIDTQWEDSQIRRRDRIKTITVGAEPWGESANATVHRLMPVLEAMDLPAGYKFEWGGEYDDSKQGQAGISAGLPFSFGMMILISIILFNSIRIPAIIWLTVPLALIGVSFGLLIANESFGFMAMLGFLSLAGMLIKNAIVLLDQIEFERATGKEVFESIIDSAVSRVRPVSMAAATTVLGMLPLVPDVFFAAMAVTVMAGLTFATALTLIVVPVLYAIFFKAEMPKPAQ